MKKICLTQNNEDIRINVSIGGSISINNFIVDAPALFLNKSTNRLTLKELFVRDIDAWLKDSMDDSQRDDIKSKADEVSNLNDKYIFVSDDTNELISQSENPSGFYDECVNLLSLAGLSLDIIENILMPYEYGVSTFNQSNAGLNIKFIKHIEFDPLTSRNPLEAEHSINESQIYSVIAQKANAHKVVFHHAAEHTRD